MNKKLICTAVGATLAASAGMAHAVRDELANDALIPYVVKDSNRTTVVTVITTANSTNMPTAGTSLHLQYQTKSTTDANTAACQPSSTVIPVTRNDIVTFDTAGLLGYPLFGDTTNPAPLGAGISYAAPRHGYLWIEALTAGTVGSGYINGAYWLELDLANGGAQGDQGFLSTAASNSLANGAFGLDHVVHSTVGGTVETAAAAAGSFAPAVAFWPSSIATQAFTVTPLGSDMLSVENNQVVMQILNYNGVQGAYDRNENGVDGTVPQTVRCVGRLTPAGLMPGVVSNAAWAAQGGFGYLANLGDNATGTSDNDAVVYQVDSASAQGKFIANATRITSNMNGNH